MKPFNPKCPICQESLQISVLRCPACGTEVKTDFALSPFDRLSNTQYDFLLSFLKAKGNLKEVQLELGISYLTVKKKLEDLLTALNLNPQAKCKMQENFDPSCIQVDSSSNKASEIVKAKLKQNGGHATVYTIQGLPCEIYAEPDGNTFSSEKIPIQPRYTYAVFDVIVDLLLRQGGRARKGNGRNFRLGERGCEVNTVVGAIAVSRGNTVGDSVFDPVFVMAAILEWAGIVTNARGELILTKAYRETL